MKYYIQRGTRHYFGRGYVLHLYRTNDNKNWQEIIYSTNKWIPSIGPDKESKEDIAHIPETDIFQLMLNGNEIFGIREEGGEIEDDIRDREARSWLSNNE